VEADLPDFDQLWDYDHPAETAEKFRSLLPAHDAGSPSYRAQLLTQLARTQSLQGHFTEAHQILDEVKGLLTGKLVTAQIRYLLERGRTFNSAHQVEQAIPLFKEAWDISRAAGEDFYAVDAAHMLAIAVPADQQMAWNYQAMTVAEQSADPKAQNWAGSLYNNMGWTEHDAGHYEAALELFQKALAFRQAKGQAPQVIIARWCVARCLRSLGRVAEALEQQQALALEDGSDGFIQEELGECLLALGQVAESVPHFAQAYATLSQDNYLAANEVSRLERLKQLGKV
jgi:tetratricopeptide (TPR) repeat protein